MSAALMKVDGLSVSFGALVVIESLSLSVQEGAIKGIIGPNGAGKTTLLNAITGSVRPKAGSIKFGEREIELTRLPPYSRARLGIGRTFQHSNLFSGLSVLDQLLCGGYHATRRSPLGTMLRTPSYLREERELLARAYRVMDRLELTPYAHQKPDRLPGATHRLVDLGRALMTQPRLLLLDEIAAGTTIEERARVIDVVRDCRAQGVSVLVIEHDLQFMRDLADDAVVLAEGHVVAAGETNDVLTRPEVLEAYVGSAE
jgi:branched-chain amino acid transport system ATP-binding protein